MLTFVKAVRSSDGKTFDTIEDAQAYEVYLMMAQGRNLSEPEHKLAKEFCRVLIENREKACDILTTKEGSLPKARKVNGGRKPRTPKADLAAASDPAEA